MAALLPALIFVLAGCSSADNVAGIATPDQLRAVSQQLRDQGHIEQADALEDGVVDEGEYADGFARFSECIRDAGYIVNDPVISPVDGITYLFDINFEGRNEVVAMDDIEVCKVSQWQWISAAYQDTAPMKMDEPLRQAAIKCLESQGYELSGDEVTPLDIAGPNPIEDGRPSQRWNDTVDCLLDEQARLYPEIRQGTVPLR